MAHPVKLLKDIEESMPNVSVIHWIFGIFRSSRNDMVHGTKGLLAINEKSLIFTSDVSEEESRLTEFSLEEVEGLEAELNGTVKITIRLNNADYVEMSYISRGSTKEFVDFLQSHCNKSKNETSLKSKME